MGNWDTQSNKYDRPFLEAPSFDMVAYNHSGKYTVFFSNQSLISIHRTWRGVRLHGQQCAAVRQGVEGEMQQIK